MRRLLLAAVWLALIAAPSLADTPPFAETRSKSKQENAQAEVRYRKAAEQGDALAQFSLGLMYERGDVGVTRDYAEAMHWYRKAADQGLAEAQSNLGAMYHDGEGVPLDYVEAYMWDLLAAAQGDANARKNLDLTETLLTPEQRAEAQKMAREEKSRSSVLPLVPF